MLHDNLSERLLAFGARTIKIADRLPNTYVGRHIGGQVLRAGTSSGSNYEEACGAESRSDFVHKLGVVLKELRESRYWLRIIIAAELLPKDEIIGDLQECEELCNIIGQSILTTRRNA